MKFMKKFLLTTFALAFVFSLSQFLFANPVRDSWLDADFDNAERILSDNLSNNSVSDYLNLIYLNFSTGKPEKALEIARRASKLFPDDAWVPILEGWTLYSMGDFEKAYQAFSKSQELSVEDGVVSNSKLGQLLARYSQNDCDKAITIAKSIVTRYPHLLPYSMYLMSKCYVDKGQLPTASVFLEQSLDFDPINYSAQLEAAKIHEKRKDRVASWQAYATLYQVNSIDKLIASKVKKFSKWLKSDSFNYLFYSRLDKPLTKSPETVASKNIKVAMFSDSSGNPVELSSFEVVSADSFAISDYKLGTIINAKQMSTWSFKFNKKKDQIDIYDPWGTPQHFSKRPIILKSDTKGYTILVKNVRGPDFYSCDYGDKELAGSIIIYPGKNGMTVVNDVSVEDFLPGALSVGDYSKMSQQALKAFAVVKRTQIYRMLLTGQNDARYDSCDSEKCIRYRGVNMEFPSARTAVKETENYILDLNGAGYPSPNLAHQACGGITYSGIDDGDSPGLDFMPVDLFKWISRPPLPTLLCAPKDTEVAPSIRWTVDFNIEGIERRVNTKYKVGKIKSIQVYKRSISGRVVSVLVSGKSKDVILSDEDEISSFIFANALRSNLYVLIPQYKGEYLKNIIVSGAGTGHGQGLCLQGADKLAQEGKNYEEILLHYFPKAKIIQVPSI
jgi:stage II sporulation protein D (peptidoglycan lytic transglycosylase)